MRLVVASEKTFESMLELPVVCNFDDACSVYDTQQHWGLIMPPELSQAQRKLLLQASRHLSHSLLVAPGPSFGTAHVFI